jgi:catechol 2,3-dioxygenase-like lactoylglutathione lyase family enzyme
MAGIKVTDIAYGRMRAPDLDEAEAFLTAFGMVRSDRTGDALYMRGTDSAHHLYVAELGAPRFVGCAFYAASEEDLHKIARADGASAVESIDEPGGGKRVRLCDPMGYQIEIVYGIQRPPPLRLSRQLLNYGAERYRRAGELMRLAKGPAHVKRMGHMVLMSTDLRKTVQWYRDTLGFLCSDDVYAEREDNLVGSFNRCDRGDEYVDHHVFFCIQGKKQGLNHLSFEVEDIDDVMLGHEHLKQQGYRHAWGIGRHRLGSQVYDYWYDAWGRCHEHWTDTDVLNARAKPNLARAMIDTASQWGEQAPQEFRENATP